MARKVVILLSLFLCLLIVYTLLRVAFYNLYFHDPVKGGSLAGMFLLGVQMDYSSLFYLNLVFLLYYFFVQNLVPVKWQIPIAWGVFLLLNLPFLAVNFIDLAYFAFTGRRSNNTLLKILPDSLTSLPAFFKAYWYLFVLFVVAAVLLAFVSKKLLNAQQPVTGKAAQRQYLWALPVLLVMAVVARGMRSREIMPPTPLLYYDAAYQPLISNSTFQFLYSMFKVQQRVSEKNYYTPQALDSLFPIRRQYAHEQAFQPKNVVIFILESYCKEFLENGHAYRAQTPFLDSLIGQSTWCNHAYANGQTSVQGIVSILGSMPSFIYEPYYHSIYSSNNIRGIGTILKEQGYSTHFFMGAGPDHFGFGKFCKLMGIDQYHSRRDYNNDDDYDGSWGIWDHRFLPYGAQVLQKQPGPFLAVFFNLSSHFPYALPADLRKQFERRGKPAFVETAAYVDYSLRLFFDSIKNTSWYKNTLFVFSADHSIMGIHLKGYEPVRSFRIPLFIHDPSNPVHCTIEKPVQQVDIVPTILDRLQYAQPFMSFGRSIHDTATSYVTYGYDGVYEVLDSQYILGYNDVKERSGHLLSIHDTDWTHNLLNQPGYTDIQKRLEQYGKAVIQRYNNSLIHNQLLVK